MRTAQENLRLSAGTLNKLQGEFKTVCGELDEAKKRVTETEGAWKRLKSESDGKLQMMADEVQRLNGLIEKKNNEIRALGGEVQDAQKRISLLPCRVYFDRTSESFFFSSPGDID